ncbi:hypothetical protein AKJ43_02860, partial [candidate division MSBL1 archaeon SCGC-AAA261D19]
MEVGMKLAEKMELQYISPEEIKVSPDNTRKRDKNKKIDELAENIDNIGLEHPISVYKDPKTEKYQCYSGQRRLAALEKLG